MGVHVVCVLLSLTLVLVEVSCVGGAAAVELEDSGRDLPRLVYWRSGIKTLGVIFPG